MTFKLLTFGAAVAWLVPSSFAGLTATLYTQSDGQPSGYRDPKSVGGEFTAVLSGNTATSKYILSHYASVATATVTTGSGKTATTTTGIETFCVEMTQTFTPGTAYNASIGGTIVPGSPTSVAQGVAWLYMEFATGGLATYGSAHFGTTYKSEDYTYATSGNGTSGKTREYSADELQDAIWYLEGEMNNNNKSYWSNSGLQYSFTTSDPYLELVTQVFGSLTNAEKSDTLPGTSNYGVMVLNLSSAGPHGTTVYAQDQLVYCPVPEPATVFAGALLLLPLGWGVLRSIRNKKAAAQA